MCQDVTRHSRYSAQVSKAHIDASLLEKFMAGWGAPVFAFGAKWEIAFFGLEFL
jgi:hypothetical protein